MTSIESFKSGHSVLPASLFFHYKDLFSSTDDFLVWQFFHLQNTTKIQELAPSQIADAIGKSVTEVNAIIANLTKAELLEVKTIELAGEVELIFDAGPALDKLEKLLRPQVQAVALPSLEDYDIKDLAADFERELGRLLSPFELEDLQKTLEEGTEPDLVREALKEAVFNGKRNWKYIQAILRNWNREGITSLRQVEERKRAREEANPQNVTVSDDFLSAMNLWAD
ncbi:DnaD domain-containing protein [Streptococcus caprae]|uniref:DnaD domain-containing protein n=1 Tax=Streptococcus caprae TaxID=1640501 RepID=A0ABV8CY24_9STRE